MTAASRTSSKIATLAIALGTAALPCLAQDAVHGGFERMLDGRAPAVQRVAVPAMPADPLLAALVLPLRDGPLLAPVVAQDPVLASFTRMLQHQPSRQVPLDSRARDADPLIAAIVLPLLRSRHLAVSHVALSTPR